MFELLFCNLTVVGGYRGESMASHEGSIRFKRCIQATLCWKNKQGVVLTAIMDGTAIEVIPIAPGEAPKIAPDWRDGAFTSAKIHFPLDEWVRQLQRASDCEAVTTSSLGAIMDLLRRQ